MNTHYWPFVRKTPVAAMTRHVLDARDGTNARMINLLLYVVHYGRFSLKATVFMLPIPWVIHYENGRIGVDIKSIINNTNWSNFTQRPIDVGTILPLVEITRKVALHSKVTSTTCTKIHANDACQSRSGCMLLGYVVQQYTYILAKNTNWIHAYIYIYIYIFTYIKHCRLFSTV